MKTYQATLIRYCLFASTLAILPSQGFAFSDAEKRAMQDQLNQQTLNKSFDPDNPANLKAYLDDAVQKGIKPPLKPSSNWRSGYTCDNISSYGYSGYRDCMLYYRYYGCYYC